jgi:hypothetical protein
MGICDHLTPTGAIKKPVLDASGRFRSWCPSGLGGSNPLARNPLLVRIYVIFAPYFSIPEIHYCENISSLLILLAVF